MATLLSICQDAAAEIGLPVPASVASNQDTAIVKLFRYAKKEGRELSKRGYWQVLRSEQTFTSLAQETQTSMIPTDFDRFVNGTFWNRTAKRPLVGPVTPQEWQTIKSWSSSPMQDTFTMRGSDILINPVPPAGQTFAFEYMSKNYCTDSGGTPKAEWTLDTDIPLLPEELFILGVRWRFLQGEGFDFQSVLATYEGQVKQALIGDTPKRTLNMSGNNDFGGRMPGVVVPEGYWNV